MSSPNCNDFVTRVEYNQLLNRLEELQYEISNVQLQLSGHISLDIPQAHRYTPEFDVITELNEQEFTTTVVIESKQVSDTTTLPDSVTPTVKLEVVPQDDYNHQIVVTVNDVQAEATLTTHQPELEFDVIELGEGLYEFSVALDEQSIAVVLELFTPEESEPEQIAPEFSVDVSKVSDLYTFAVTINGVTQKDSITIDSQALELNRRSFIRRGGGGSNMECEGLTDAMQLNLNEILAAIAAVQAQVTQVKGIVTIEVEGKALTKFDCPATDPESGKESKPAKTKDYKLATLPAIHEMLGYLNQNQVTMFEKICEGGTPSALPAWWQPRLNANVPQLGCVFRKGGSSTYHTISIPHPANTDKPKKAVLPAYTKGNYQGMVVCRDNSKFIINCVSQAEAERMCNIAIALIHGDFLELPPRVYIGERKGQAVSVDPMLPTSVEYFESGQRNTIPNWRLRVKPNE